MIYQMMSIYCQNPCVMIVTWAWQPSPHQHFQGVQVSWIQSAPLMQQPNTNIIQQFKGYLTLSHCFNQDWLGFSLFLPFWNLRCYNLLHLGYNILGKTQHNQNQTLVLCMWGIVQWWLHIVTYLLAHPPWMVISYSNLSLYPN